MSESFPGAPVENSFESKKEDKKQAKEKAGSSESILSPLQQSPESKPDKSNSLFELFKDSKETTKEALELNLPKAEDAPEQDAPLKEIGEKETPDIVQAYAEYKLPLVEAELAQAEPGSAEEAAAEAVIDDLEALQTDGDMEAPIALSETAAEEEESPELHEEPAEQPEKATTIDDEEGEIPLQATTVNTAAPTTQTGGSGGSNIPPRRPPTPAAGQPQPIRNPNVLSSRNPDTVTTAEAAYYARQAENRGLFVGGVLGYLIGRRRGRIKTEKRLMPVQKRLERQVEAIQTRLEAREAEVRRMATARHLRHHSERYEQRTESPRARATEQRSEVEPSEPISRLELEKPKRLERLGHAVVAAEAPGNLDLQPVKPELANIKPEHVRAMKRSELLVLSEKILVEGASLRQIYESHLVGERGLRRLISEYLQGKDIRKELQREMVEREIDFERDPMLRDAAFDSLSNSSTSGSSPTLQQLLQKAGADNDGDDSLSRVAERLAKYQEKQQKRHTHRVVADTAMVTLIVVLAAAVVVLLLRS